MLDFLKYIFAEGDRTFGFIVIVIIICITLIQIARSIFKRK